MNALEPGSLRAPRMPLAAFPLVSGRDPARLEYEFQRLGVERRRIHLKRGAAARFLSRVTGRALGTVQLFGVNFSFGTRIESEALHCVQIMQPVSGTLGFRDDRGIERTLAPGAVLALSPLDRIDFDWRDGAVVRCLRIPNIVFEDYLQANFHIAPRSPIRFDKSDLGAAASMSLRRVLDALFEDLGDVNGAAHGICGRQWLDLLLMSVLQLIPNSVAGKLVGDPRIDGRPGLERAIGYIREHIAEPVAMRDLVAASGISARSLQLAFRKAYGMGPISFVRNLRLQYVRDELRAATAAGTLVADVAGRWGFFNVSHFTQVYKRRFHSLPSADLRGRRVAGVRRGCCADAIANAENQ